MNHALDHFAAAIAAVLLMGTSMAAVIEVPHQDLAQDLGAAAPMNAEIAALPQLA